MTDDKATLADEPALMRPLVKGFDPLLITGVRQEPTWVFTCPVESCHEYEAGFTDQHEADNALYEHIDERHN
jgi:hypothetical protein